MKIQYEGKVKDGKLTMINRKYFAKEMDNFEGKTVLVTIEKKKLHRSTYQNRYYWGVVIPIVREGIKETGDILTNEQVHEMLKFRFLGESLSLTTNPIYTFTNAYCKSTTELSTTEFMEYIAEIQQFATEFLNTYIPDPQESLGISIT